MRPPRRHAHRGRRDRSWKPLGTGKPAKRFSAFELEFTAGRKDPANAKPVELETSIRYGFLKKATKGPYTRELTRIDLN